MNFGNLFFGGGGRDSLLTHETFSGALKRMSASHQLNKDGDALDCVVSRRRNLEEIAIHADRTSKAHKVKITLTKPGIELIWVEDASDSEKDAYTHDFDVDVKGQHPAIRDLGIHALCFRRDESGINQTAKNPPDFKYSRKYFVKIVEGEKSTMESRLHTAELVAEVSIFYAIFMWRVIR